MDAAFRIWASLLSLAVIVQVSLAGYGAFHAVDVSDDNGSIGKKGVEHGFNPHAALGYVILLAAIVLVLLAFFARRHAPELARLRRSGLLLGLIVLPVVLARL